MQDLEVTKQTTNTPGTQQGEEEYPHLTEEEVEEIFCKALADIPPHLLLPQKTAQEKAIERQVALMLLIAVFSFIIGSVIAIITYPTAIVVITPISKSVSYTTQLDLKTRNLAPVTLTKTATIPTTGTGHQAATRATGTLTFYNGSFSSQTMPAGSMFTGADGIQVHTDAAVTVPANNPPQDGIASIAAYAINPGSKGNIQALDIDLAVSSDLLVKNLTAFSHGQDARTYRAVAQKDINTLTSTLKTTLTQHIPQAFRLNEGEALVITHCVFIVSINAQVGQEAASVTAKAAEACHALAYGQERLQQLATAAFIEQTRPGAPYELVNMALPQVIRTNPFTVQISGRWVYVLSQDYQQVLAQHLAGESPQQAKAYLLNTGLIQSVTVSQQLPKDPQHIKFLELIDA